MSGFGFPVNINNIAGGVVQFGPSVFTSPKSASKTFAGAGTENLGILVTAITAVNATNTLDVDGIDQPIVKDF